MPGICGFHNLAPTDDAHHLLAAMTERLTSPLTKPAGRAHDPVGRYGLASVSLGILSTEGQPAKLAGDARVAVLEGEIFDVPRRIIADGGSPSCADDDHFAAALLRATQSGAGSGVADLDGSFAAAIVDPENQTLTLITDRFGTRPIYYAHDGQRFLFASRIAPLLADPVVSRDPDWTGFAQFFTFGHYFQENTSLAAVKVVPAAAVLVFDARRNRFTIERYWCGATAHCLVAGRSRCRL